MIEFMREAVDLARLGKGYTAPNPCVGAVLILDNRVVARGWHTACGRPHAEVEAIRDAREKGINPGRCSMAVTLEPCNHQGKTPPCTQAILDSGISRVVIGTPDPNPDVAGGGMRFLQENGVKTELLDPDGICADLIADFRHWREKDTPYIYLKLAATLDGKIATSSGDSKWITCQRSREMVHDLRSRVGAVMVGGNTFRCDNPGLDCRLPGSGQEQPLAVVVTRNLPTPGEGFGLLSKRPEQTMFWTTSDGACSEEANRLISLGCRVWGLSSRSARIDLKTGLKRLRSELDLHYCLCEGGSKLAMSLVRSGLAQELWYFQAPCILGDTRGKAAFSGEDRPDMQTADRLRVSQLFRIDRDIFMRLFFTE
ncbi:MAG: bifunctional diaminohydroxyphosphoribosylaminopyrimidine deaminase/5-amino-6-(5-phosphoribosylamino)uracil reductase RibD [Desulfonatronovibrionaceae bacterium]